MIPNMKALRPKRKWECHNAPGYTTKAQWSHLKPVNPAETQKYLFFSGPMVLHSVKNPLNIVHTKRRFVLRDKSGYDGVFVSFFLYFIITASSNWENLNHRLMQTVLQTTDNKAL